MVGEGRDGADDAGEGPAEPVHGDDDHRVAGPDVDEQPGQPGPVLPGAGELVAEDPLAPGCGERVGLGLERLAAGPHPGVPSEIGVGSGISPPATGARPAPA